MDRDKVSDSSGVRGTSNTKEVSKDIARLKRNTAITTATSAFNTDKMKKGITWLLSELDPVNTLDPTSIVQSRSSNTNSSNTSSSIGGLPPSSSMNSSRTMHVRDRNRSISIDNNNNNHNNGNINNNTIINYNNIINSKVIPSEELILSLIHI